VAETCTGSSAACPSDSFRASGYACRAATGACDVAETCTGSSAACPTDRFRTSSHVCRASAGACDVAETCTGSSATCPSNRFASAGTVCRAAAGSCDVAEVCSGAAVGCPADAHAPDGSACSDGDPCTVDACSGGLCVGVLPLEVCDGIDNDCDTLTDEGVSCVDYHGDHICVGEIGWTTNGCATPYCQECACDLLGSIARWTSCSGDCIGCP
ncbi:MAG: hypothetical protein JXB32_23735, partial [Deltaproteobacteria bacterium]|nr:hypothetical protein [Deltaproteobacteria bacterium]